MTKGHTLRYGGFGMWLALCLGAGAQPAPPSPPGSQFEHYGIIIERKPFGTEALPAVAEPPKISPDKSFTAKYKMAAVTRDDHGVIRVGLVNIITKQSHMLGMGDSVEGVEVVDADYVKERARLRRDPEDYWVSMSGGSNSYEVVTKEQAPQLQAGATALPASSAAVAKRSVAGRSSYAARREARLRKELQQLQAIEAQRAKEAKTTDASSVASVRAGRAKPNGKTEPASETAQALLRLLNNQDHSELAPEEINALLQEYQKELIRTGQTPLPIPLTPETDQALVEEGILPAIE